MSSSTETPAAESNGRAALLKTLDVLSMPALATLMAFIGGGLVIWLTSGNLGTVFTAYEGMISGAFLKTRGFTETLVAMTPYVFLGLGLAIGFKAGLFNVGVEGQFYIGALAASLGSQFWFDVLVRFVNIRAAGVKPDDTPKENPKEVGD